MNRGDAESSSLKSGDRGRELGADFITRDDLGDKRGSSVEHISQYLNAEWLRNVHTVHAMELAFGAASKLDDEDNDSADTADDAGKDSERCDSPKPIAFDEGTDARGTPHNPHILAAAGLNPGGLR